MTLVFVGIMVASCGDAPLVDHSNAGDTTCPATVAQVGIADSSFVSYCGCAEGAGTRVFTPGAFTCTITQGMAVIFNFAEGLQSHQVLSTGTPSFPSSPPNRTKSRPSGVLAHGVVFDAVGTYDFQDPFLPGITGQIVVNP